MEQTASQRVFSLLLHRLGDAEFNPVSDRALARCLKISHVQAGRLRKGETRMSYAAFIQALRYLDLPPDEHLNFELEYQREVTGDQGAVEFALSKIREADMAAVAAKFFGKSAAGIVGAILAAAMLAHPQPAQAMTYPADTMSALSTVESTGYIGQVIHYAK